MNDKRMVKNFTDFINENKETLDTYETSVTLDSFYSGDITNEKLEETLLLEMESFFGVNEGLKEILKSGIKGIQNWFFKMLASILKLVKTGGQKIISGIQSLVNTIKKFEAKHPVLFKALAILIIILILMIVSSSQAMASDGGDGMQQMMGQLVDISAGLVSDLKDSGSLDGMDIDSIGQGLESVKREVLQTGDVSGAINNIDDETVRKVLKIVIKEAGEYTGDNNDMVRNLVKSGKSFLFDYADTNLNISFGGN